MRFATFVAFMLPLAAFAAPTPTPRQADSDLSVAFEDKLGNYSLALSYTVTAVNEAVVQLGASNNSQELSVLDTLLNLRHDLYSVDVFLADNNSVVNTFLKSQYVDIFSRTYTMVKYELIPRFCSM